MWSGFLIGFFLLYNQASKRDTFHLCFTSTWPLFAHLIKFTSIERQLQIVLVVKNYRDNWNKLWIVYENLSTNKEVLIFVMDSKDFYLWYFYFFYKSYKHKIATYICILMHYLTHLHNDLHAIPPLTITWYSSWYFITWHSSKIHYLQFLY